jgi:uncharacterized protein YjbI with pentapeptide repeats
MDNQHRVKHARELLRRYQVGEQAFKGAELSRADLEGASLEGIDLSGANLDAAKLKKADLRVLSQRF